MIALTPEQVADAKMVFDKWSSTMNVTGCYGKDAQVYQTKCALMDFQGFVLALGELRAADSAPEVKP